MTREAAFNLFKQYNTQPFLFQHALTVEGCMRHFARVYGEDEAFWGVVGLLHDIDFEQYPDEHCVKAAQLLRDAGADETLVHAVCAHGFGMTATDAVPSHFMEKLLFAADELTGLIGAAARMRPSKSAQDMELASLKKKFKDKKFAAGCSRAVIEQGAKNLGWELDRLLEETLQAYQACEAAIFAQL